MKFQIPNKDGASGGGIPFLAAISVPVSAPDDDADGAGDVEPEDCDVSDVDRYSDAAVFQAE
jgi:hypothetical protein